MQTPKRNKKIAYLLTPIALAASQAFVVSAYAEEAKLAPVEVVATTPLAGIGIPKEQIAANVQTATGQQIEDSGALNIADYMNKNMSGVHVNDNQGNPFQVDLNYRGFTASPLLGTPQGISVYMDGVRMNQPFGDIVQWDLIPKSAIKNMTLIPGSNPLFGLNTLGGAISIQTKDGLSYQGTEVEAGVGSHGRYSTEFETGGKNENGLNWYVNATRWAEDGWRDASPSGITQLFSKLGWKNRDTDVKLTYALANSNLTGNGLQQKELLDSNYKSVFTKPDQTHNNSNFLNLEGKHSINENTIFTGNAYYRKTNTRTFNGDLNEDSIGQKVFGTLVTQDDTGNYYYRNGQFPNGQKCKDNAPSDEPNEKCTGIITRTTTQQENFGLSGQFSFLTDSFFGKNNLSIGSLVDLSKISFNQRSQFAYLTSDRGMVGVNAYADGSQTSEGAYDNTVDLSGKVKNFSLYLSNIVSTTDYFHTNFGMRYNYAKISNTDNYAFQASNNAEYSWLMSSTGRDCSNLSGANYTKAECVYARDNGRSMYARDSLSGNHSYARLNPSLGFVFEPSKSLNTYLRYSESNRAPTSIELGCANENFGCRLPNSMAGDPPLKQVVSKNWELGARGKLSEYLMNWSVGLFNINNYDDILFVANSASTGYFKNFGQTRRRGVELGLSGKDGRVSYAMNYTYLDATYRSQEEVGGQYNNTADNDLITVKKGNKIPLMPSNLLKFRVAYDLTPTLIAGLGMNAVSSSYARGNENNEDPRGKVPGYALFDLNARYKVDQQLTVTGMISNLMDRRYYTSGQLGPNAFTSSGGWNNGGCGNASSEGACQSTMMYSPGAPRTFWVSMRYTFDKPRKD